MGATSASSATAAAASRRKTGPALAHRGAEEMTSLADRFVSALRTFDAEAMTQLLASDAVGWLNVGNRSRSVEEFTALLRLERALVPSAALHVLHQTNTEDGFVVQFVLDGTTRGGAHLHIRICIVAEVVDGRIGHFDEYTDEASTGPLREEFLASAPASSATTR